jgi:hypothetical protein
MMKDLIELLEEFLAVLSQRTQALLHILERLFVVRI